ncbi:MAG: hypothetical protein B7C24_08875 [Bacteroidetes bacterium 4572_77]|nr:MAG: hypothetical protein B7C24_08875 [Bacteroidetes bacterium 4572_77]
MKTIWSIITVVSLGLLLSITACEKDEDPEQEYKTYSVEYVLKNNLNQGKRFIITYKNPNYANQTTEQFESIKDTVSFKFEAKSLDYLYLSAQSQNDTANYEISIFVDAVKVIMDSASCNWQCDSTFVEITYALP